MDDMEASLLCHIVLFYIWGTVSKKVEDKKLVSLSFVTVLLCFPNNFFFTVFMILEGPHKIFMKPSNKLRNAIDIVMLMKLILNCV